MLAYVSSWAYTAEYLLMSVAGKGFYKGVQHKGLAIISAFILRNYAGSKEHSPHELRNR